MRAIAITAFNRPHYLRRMLDTLTANDLDGWQVFASVEPSPVRDEICALIAGRLPDARIDLNARLLGVDTNPYKVLLTAFGAGSELVVYVEDDMVLAPDVTGLAEWYSTQAFPVRTMCLCLFSRDQGSAEEANHLRYRKDGFSALGVVLTRAQWLAYFQPVWFHNPRGWDFSVKEHALLSDPELFTVVPLVSRANHIGREGGAHCSPEFHDAIFPAIRVFEGPPPATYVALDPPR